jgi:hypothetical protein
MKTLKQFMEETSFRTRVVPAIKHPSGKIYRGKRGEDHSEIRERHMNADGKHLEGEAGFYDPKEKHFHSRSDMGGIDSTRMLTPDERDARMKRLAGGRSSTDDMTNVGRMRKYGTFEEE